MKDFSYQAEQVYAHDRDLYLQSLFISSEKRDMLLALCALYLELDAVGGKIHEEMIGHIRLAWWQEALEKLYTGVKTPGHPLLEALYPFAQSGAMPQTMVMEIIQKYRACFPEPPTNRVELVNHAAVRLVQIIAPESLAGWERAGRIINAHRHKHGKKWQPWLLVKLLIAGF